MYNWINLSSWEEVESTHTTVYLTCTEELLHEVVDAKGKALCKLKENYVFEVEQSSG